MTYYALGGVNRYVCTVLEEMRAQLKVLDKVNIERYRSMTWMMIEETQTHVNNMEAALSDWEDLRSMKKSKQELKAELKVLIKQKDDLEKEIEKKKANMSE